MAINLNLNILPKFAVTGTSLNLIHCIEEFDSGFNNVYILDENEEYTGFAVTKKSFRDIWKSIDESLISVPGILEQNDNQKILNMSIKIFKNNPDLTEIPLLKNKHITSIVTGVMPNQARGYNWSAITDVNLSPDMRSYKKIYLSSLENQDMLNFYNCWNTRLPLLPLGNNNLMNAINDEDSLLIYAEDLFPKDNKMSIVELWNKLVTYALKQMLNFCYISPNWASIKQSESHNRALFVQKFDQGFHSVSVVDEDDRFIELVVRSTFREDFPKKNFRKWNNLYIDYSDNEDNMRWLVANWCFGTLRKEIPILRNGKVVATGRLGKVSSLLQGKEDLFPPIYWDLIDDEIAEDFFGEQRKILISSDYGNLAGFRERFDKMLDITVYDDSVWEKYLSGEFDMLIYGANVWSVTKTIKYSAKDLYIYLINEKIKNYLMKNGVDYYTVGYGGAPILNVMQRIDYSENRVKSQTVFGGIYNDYTVFSDFHDENNWNFTGGIRKTIGTPEKYERNFHFFGPCIASGWFVRDHETVESYLQEIINKNNIPCKIINYGQRGALLSRDINILYLLMDTNFHKGDIVIFLGMLEKNIVRKEEFHNHFFMEDIFNKFGLRNRKTFNDSYFFHVNAEGSKVVAEFLWEKLQDKLLEKVEQPQKVVKSLFNSLITPPPCAA